MLQIFIPSYNRATTHTTPALLEQAGVTSYKVVVRKSQWQQYRATVRDKNLLVLPNEGDLTMAREFTRQLLRNGEWCLQMDDNVRGFIMPEHRLYHDGREIQPGKGETMITRARWQAKMNVPVLFSKFYDLVVHDTLTMANIVKAYLCGFSAHENPAFRARKWADVGYVCGKAMLMQNQGLPWKQSAVSSGEDYALTAAHLFENGRVLVNKWGHPLRTHYQPGGCGPYLERLPAMLAAQQDLTARYGQLFGIKNANHPEKKQGELRIRFHSLEQVIQWHERFSYDPNYRIEKGKLMVPVL